MSLNDQRIINNVMQSILWDARVSPASIAVECEKGVVTLRGAVDNNMKKWSAEQTALRVDGVKKVVNTILVVPTQKLKDNEIEANIKNMLALDTRLDNTAIKISVQNGLAALTGEVNSLYQKFAAEETCRWARGVIDVQNLISVEYKAKKIDKKIKQELERRIGQNEYFDNCNITVAVENHIVLLSGEVTRKEQRLQAEAIASQLANVVFVNNKLVVRGER